VRFLSNIGANNLRKKINDKAPSQPDL